MNKKLFAALLLVCAVLFSGCQLAKPEASAENGDRLVGVLVTDHYLDLFDFEAYAADHAGELLAGKPMDAAGYEGRIYGRLTQTGFDPSDTEGRWMNYDLTFPVEGYFMVSLVLSGSGDWEPGGETYGSIFGNGGFAEVSSAIKTTDEGTEETMELTIAFCQEQDLIFYANPIFQTSDGQVYVAPSHGGMQGSLLDGGGMTQTQSASVSVTENGQTKTDSMEVIVHAVYQRPAEELTILEMDEENRVLNTCTYAPDDIPEEKDLGDAAYVILQTTDGKKTERTIYTPGDESAVYYVAEGAVCMPAYLRLNWGK